MRKTNGCLFSHFSFLTLSHRRPSIWLRSRNIYPTGGGHDVARTASGGDLHGRRVQASRRGFGGDPDREVRGGGSTLDQIRGVLLLYVLIDVTAVILLALVGLGALVAAVCSPLLVFVPH